MERLTLLLGKIDKEVCGSKGLYSCYYNRLHDCCEVIDSIQEELGIPLEVLFKALKDGIWTYDYDKNITRTDSVELGLGINGWYLTNMSYIVWIKDYGKTWWLEEPKEELENA